MNGELVMLNSEIPGISSGRTPFYNQRLSDSYAHFYRLAHRNGERLFFASAEDFFEDGTVRGYWIPEGAGWRPVEKPIRMGMLFDKLGGDDALFNAVLARVQELKIPVYGHYGLNRFTGDKWECYKVFPREHALTRTIEPDRSTVEAQIDAFFNLMDDVYSEHDNRAVLKPRWGWESRGLFLLRRTSEGVFLETLGGQVIYEGAQVARILDGLVADPYIIQAFVNTAQGIPELGLNTDRHDARFVFSIGRPGVAEFVQAYVKTPAKMLYYPLSAFPAAAFEVLESVAAEVARRFPYGIFSVDIMRDSSGRWFLTELNDQVGFNIDFDSPRDIHGVTQLMERYLSEMYNMRANLHLPHFQSAS
jgi:hypothetical protein